MHETPQGRLTNSTFLATSRDSVLLDSDDRNPARAETFGMLAGSKVVEKIQMSNRSGPQSTINHAVGVLLAEDEGVLALMMRDTLAEQGFSVVGPFAKAGEPIAAARDKHVHGAVLDVNLNGEMIYPVAELLKGRGVPFIFISGCESDSIDVRFSGIPVLRKPIERQALQNVFVFGKNGLNCGANVPCRGKNVIAPAS